LTIKIFHRDRFVKIFKDIFSTIRFIIFSKDVIIFSSVHIILSYKVSNPFFKALISMNIFDILVKSINSLGNNLFMFRYKFSEKLIFLHYLLIILVIFIKTFFLQISLFFSIRFEGHCYVKLWVPYLFFIQRSSCGVCHYFFSYKICILGIDRDIKFFEYTLVLFSISITIYSRSPSYFFLSIFIIFRFSLHYRRSFSFISRNCLIYCVTIIITHFLMFKCFDLFWWLFSYIYVSEFR
jgi:hypothetical protein